MSSLATFMLGALAMASFFAVVVFLRFWKSTSDRLFIFFASAFLVLALDWTALGLLAPSTSVRHYIFVVRLIAFVLIIVGIVDKNRARPRE